MRSAVHNHTGAICRALQKLRMLSINRHEPISDHQRIVSYNYKYDYSAIRLQTVKTQL